MAKQNTVYNIFIASPGDTAAEENIIRKTCEKLNQRPFLRLQGIQLAPAGWEEAMPQAGDPQEIINLLAAQCDLFICLLHRRFDSHPGTLELFLNNYDRWKKFKKPEIFLYFKQVSLRSKEDIEDPQLIRVMDFKNRVEKDHLVLYKEFTGISDFTGMLELHLEQWLSSLRQNETDQEQKKPVQSVQEIVSPKESLKQRKGKGRVFLSHSSADKAAVARIKSLLEQKQIPVWYDLDDLDLGDPLVESITRGIEESVFVAVFCLSNRSGQNG